MLKPSKFIIYRRISTIKQEESGLGLDAQMNEINLYLAAVKDYEIIAEFTETASGKDHLNRPELLKAMELASKTGACILVNRLDRISRDLEFVASLMKNPKVSFKVATQPNADNFTLAIYAAIGMKERELISIRTKNALQALKKSGKRLGVAGSRNIKKANEVKKQQACKFASKLKPVIQPLRNQGKTYQQIANILNEMGCTTAQGKSFKPIQVSRIMDREVVGIS